MDGQDLELFERSLRYATETHTGTALDDALTELGWVDALADDPRAAISILFEMQGRAGATSSAVDLVVTATLDPAGEPTTGVVLPAIATWDPPGTLTDGQLAVDGLAGAGLAGSATATVVATGGDGPVVLTVSTSSLVLDAVEGVDPDAALVRVTGSVADAGGSATALAPERWSAAVALARLALAHELVGASRRMLELAREHALERVQFGVPISSFQAIRHRLAETLVAIEAADAVLDAAWLDGTPESAAMAKAVAGRGARTAMRHCQQTLAGIGFTTEHDLHRFIRRTLVLDAMFGTATTLTRDLGHDLIASRTLPPLLPL